MREVEATVYNPSDNWERALQDAAKLMTGDWLPSHPCQLLSQAVASLKIGTDWLDRNDLLRIRAAHLFSPQLTNNKQKLVFATHLLFLRDILENREINSNLHQPISFIADPLAHFLFRNFPVHIYVNDGLLRKANPKISFLDIGGFLIVQEGNVRIEDGVISDIKYFGHKADEVAAIVNEIKRDSGLQFMKAASTEIDDDVFEISEHFKDIRPGSQVWDKLERSNAQVEEVEPGENGLVFVKRPDESLVSVPKQEFDQRFVISLKTAQSANPIQAALIARGVQGDELLNALDLAKDLSEVNAEISSDGIVTLYHRTTPESAQNIAQTSTMTAREDRLFFGTSPTGQIEGYGDAVVQVYLPLEKLELNDVFPGEAHVTMKSGRIGTTVPVRGRLYGI